MPIDRGVETDLCVYTRLLPGLKRKNKGEGSLLPFRWIEWFSGVNGHGLHIEEGDGFVATLQKLGGYRCVICLIQQEIFEWIAC